MEALEIFMKEDFPKEIFPNTMSQMYFFKKSWKLCKVMLANILLKIPAGIIVLYCIYL